MVPNIETSGKKAGKHAIKYSGENIFSCAFLDYKQSVWRLTCLVKTGNIFGSPSDRKLIVHKQQKQIKHNFFVMPQ